jgi:sodium transport system permease protein
VPWLYFVPVLAPLVAYSWLALRWAIEQFKREEVLFREAERLDIGLWLRRLFREKEAWPTTAQALFCFALVIFLRWVSFGLAPTLSLLSHSAIGLIAFMAAPPLFMALLLTTRPRQALALRVPAARSVVSAMALAVLLLLPLVEVTRFTIAQFPEIKAMLLEHHPLTQTLENLRQGAQQASWSSLGMVACYQLTLGVLPAVCEELAFRGFILTGLLRRFQPGTAIVMSSFLFAFAHLNVFQFLPSLLLGLVLGLMTVRSGSVVPGMVFHFIHNALLIALVPLTSWTETSHPVLAEPVLMLVLVVLSVSLAALVLRRVARLSPRPVPVPIESDLARCEEATCS